MVARYVRNYGTPFKGHQGVTQGGTPSPTIVNMVDDAVICNWVTLVGGEEAGPYNFGQTVNWIAALFYSNNGLLA